MANGLSGYRISLSARIKGSDPFGRHIPVATVPV